MYLLGYLFGSPSERRLFREVRVNLAVAILNGPKELQHDQTEFQSGENATDVRAIFDTLVHALAENRSFFLSPKRATDIDRISGLRQTEQ